MLNINFLLNYSIILLFYITKVKEKIIFFVKKVIFSG